MKTKFKFLVVLGFFMIVLNLLTLGQVSINTDGTQPDPSSMLDVKSTNKGVLIPRLTLGQRNAILNPAEGLMVFCTDCGTNGAINLYSNGTWGIVLASPCFSSPPIAGTHVALANQITWNWNTTDNAIGYKWNTINNYATASDLGTSTTKTETGLSCLIPYTRFIWAYYDCGISVASTLTQTTLSVPTSPITSYHSHTASQITWRWNQTYGAIGYKWNTTNNYATATDMGLLFSKSEANLACNTTYTRYVWAYNECGNSPASILTQATLSNPDQPAPGANIPSLTQIVWKWNAVVGGVGYKWNTTNNYATAIDMGLNLMNIETSLICNTSYTRYIWSYNACANSNAVTLTQATLSNPPSAPASGTHIPSVSQIVWNWNTVSGATGYKWNTTNNYATATDMGTATTKTEAGLTCNYPYIRYAWAYSSCSYSTPVTLTQATSTLNPPGTPAAGLHVTSPAQIVWNWYTVSGATGYKWSSSNDYASAINMGTTTTKTETGLTCNSAYTRYVWAYGSCGNSFPLTLTQTTTTIINPTVPGAGTQVPSFGQIVWNWNSVPGATGYKWNTENNYATAINMGTAITKTETGLICSTVYTRYIWANNECGNSTPVSITQSTLACLNCSTAITISHVAGAVAPVTKMVTYGIVTNIPGETGKCWISSNLGADHPATSADDPTEASAGWYWQFNRKQGYKHDGTSRTPNTTWITPINENSDWIATNDPCTIEIGSEWRIPTITEWINVFESGSWTTWNDPWNSDLKLHCADYLKYSDGSLGNPGSSGYYWSSSQGSTSAGQGLDFRSNGVSSMSYFDKTFGQPIRCIRDY